MFVLFIQNEQKTTNIKTSCVRVSNNKRETQGCVQCGLDSWTLLKTKTILISLDF